MEYTESERYWIWLSSVEGIGVKRFHQLMTVFGEPREVWDNLGAPEMRFLGKKALESLRAARNGEALDQLFERLERADTRAIPFIHPDYPARLAEIYDYPPTLYVRGDADLSAERMISVVGSRRCTRDGQRAAKEIAQQLAREDVTVISGMARGVDTCAHEGALAGGGVTIAVFGCGTDVIYPPENAELAQRIVAEGGTLISEYPPGTAPNAGHFPARNRIISGLSQGMLLIEAAKGSGAMITVQYALDQDRDVFAVPGSIYSPLSSMPNQLIVDGAKPVLSAWEILEYYHWAQRPQSAAAPKHRVELDDTERMIVTPLTEQPLTFEELRGQLNLPVARLNAHLTMLELRGIVVRMPGGMYRAYLPKD